jgi:hypothetical protein
MCMCEQPAEAVVAPTPALHSISHMRDTTCIDLRRCNVLFDVCAGNDTAAAKAAIKSACASWLPSVSYTPLSGDDR